MTKTELRELAKLASDCIQLEGRVARLTAALEYCKETAHSKDKTLEDTHKLSMIWVKCDEALHPTDI